MGESEYRHPRVRRQLTVWDGDPVHGTVRGGGVVRSGKKRNERGLVQRDQRGGAMPAIFFIREDRDGVDPELDGRGVPGDRRQARRWHFLGRGKPQRRRWQQTSVDRSAPTHAAAIAVERFGIDCGRRE